MENNALGNYQLINVMARERSFLCSDETGNLVVLKKLDADCLHRDQLHPAIRDRLAAIREIAHPNIAPLRTVERSDGHPYLVWNFVPGKTWDEAGIAATGERSGDKLASAVRRLHDLGIVHGNIHSRNIIIQAGGDVWLTDLSPYLYTDPQVDLDALNELLPPANKPDEPVAITNEHANVRFFPLIGALVCVVLIGLVFVAVRWKVSTPTVVAPVLFPSLRH